MTSVEDAKKLIVKTAIRLNPVQLEITKSLNYVLAEDINSPIHYPPFDQSAMDGFAILHSDILEQKEIEIIGEAPAGNPFKAQINSGQTVRIFTGGEIPDGTDAVIIQERVSIKNNTIISDGAPLAEGANIRRKGSLIKKGDVALMKGMVINPGAIGFLSSLGIEVIPVYPKPKVSIIITGNELQKPGTALINGQIYESNSFALIAALESIHISVHEVVTIADDEKQTTAALQQAMSNSDIVLVSGGISVGKYDYVGNCLQELNVETVFYKIYQKPGKPLFFGKQKECLIFGLPGNPASVLNCFYEYVFPAVKIMQGYKEFFLKKLNLPFSADYNKKEGLSLFLKAKIIDGQAEVLTGQESNNIGAFAFADCIIYLPAAKGNVKAKELVEVHLLPH